MYTKIYNLKFPTISEAKIAVSFLSEEIGGKISSANIEALSILLDKEGQVNVSVKFDNLDDLKRFTNGSAEVFENLRRSFPIRMQEISAVAVFNYVREAGTTA